MSCIHTQEDNDYKILKHTMRRFCHPSLTAIFHQAPSAI